MTEVHFYKPEAPESIWIDRGPNGGWMFRTEKLHDSVRQYVPADIVETQAAEIKRLKNILRDCDPESMSWLDARDAALGETE